MNGWQRRVVGYFFMLFLALVGTAVAYRWGMATYEGRPQTFLDSLQFTVEMFTTTGFGGDAPWDSPQMQAFIVVTDLLGMALLVGALPVVATPLLEAAFTETAPTTLENGVSGHVVICSYTTRAEVLIEELEAHDVPYVVVESDRERADELYGDGHRVIRADPESAEGLTAARLTEARALVADVSDRVDASIVLAAKELAEDVSVVSVVDDPELERYHRLAGADHVLSPRPLLGRGLAAKVTTALRTELDEAVAIGEDLRLAEVSVRHGGELAGSTLADSGIRERAGVNVVGAWFQGEFDASPSPDATLTRGTVLLVSGRSDQLQRLVEMTQSSVRRFAAGRTVIAGYGQVGRAVAAELDDAGIPYTVVDADAREGVDVVGDVTEPETISEARVANADTVVIALPDDTTTEFATLVIRDTAPDTEIVARVDEESNVSKTYRAGADYVLSLATVTGRMSASRLLEGRDVLSIEQQVEVIRLEAPRLVGRTLFEADVRGETGCTVMAIERGEEVITEMGPETTVERGDELVVVGTDDGIRAFERAFV
ncbi:Trk K+ transport system, NAD-binding component [Halorubrum aquaticum]|uniref:Trk K+ transport system, NAD-binding component n=1 Tax=Halorubrum aquaticum TaxID=387340 RepID=A0A1I2Z9A9_9EURY|nr:NAD-binding protein [Halorubrum aquaticum]SFH34129.1 Trk K+ transport system, NAD-binding component [Halorubrum aquaticum]